MAHPGCQPTAPRAPGCFMLGAGCNHGARDTAGAVSSADSATELPWDSKRASVSPSLHLGEHGGACTSQEEMGPGTVRRQGGAGKGEATPLLLCQTPGPRSPHLHRPAAAWGVRLPSDPWRAEVRDRRPKHRKGEEDTQGTGMVTGLRPGFGAAGSEDKKQINRTAS